MRQNEGRIEKHREGTERRGDAGMEEREGMKREVIKQERVKTVRIDVHESFRRKTKEDVGRKESTFTIRDKLTNCCCTVSSEL